MQKVFTIDNETLTKNYKFLDQYDGYVAHKETGLVYKANFINGFVQLIEVSNLEALEKIEKGLEEFGKQLAQEMGFDLNEQEENDGKSN
jgi:hypothetical protein